MKCFDFLFKKTPQYALFLVSIFSMFHSTYSFANAYGKHQSLYVMSFNVLAPCWSNPENYPKAVESYLDRVSRRKKIILFLNRAAKKADIIALQEVTQIEFQYVKEELERDFYTFHALNDPSYWSDWITPGIPWEPNGVALLIKKSTFMRVKFQDIPLTNDGNHSAYFEGIQKSSGLLVRGASVHFDSDKASNRHAELRAVLRLFKRDSTSPSIIAGDFNYGTEKGVIKKYLDVNHFVDVLKKLHRDEWTHPFSMDGDRNNGILDHIVVKNASPIDGNVHNFNLWQRYSDDEPRRIIANLKISGSDHFPIYGIVK